LLNPALTGNGLTQKAVKEPSAGTKANLTALLLYKEAL
jgi:hypothetical protein